MKKLNIAYSLLLSMATIASTGQSILAFERQSKWEQVRIIKPADIKVPKANQLSSAFNDLFVSRQLIESDIDDRSKANSFKSLLKNTGKNFASDDIRVQSIRYAEALAYAKAGEYKKARSLIKRALLAELKRDYKIEKRWRKHLTEKVIEAEKMESRKQFNERFKNLEKKVKTDYYAATLYRMVRLFYNERFDDARSLNRVVLLSLDGKKAESSCLDSILLWHNLLLAEDGSVPVPKIEDEEKKKLANGLKRAYERDYDKAASALSKVPEMDQKDDSNIGINVASALIKARVNQKIGKDNVTISLLKELSNKALSRKKGYFDSFVYRPSLGKSLEILEYSVDRQFFKLSDRLIPKTANRYGVKYAISEAVKAAYSKSNKKPEKKQVKLSEQDKIKLKSIVNDYYFVGYKYKVQGKQFDAQRNIGLASAILKFYLPNDKTMLDGILYDLGESYTWSKNYDVGSVYLTECLALRKELGRDNSSIVMTIETLARALMRSNSPKEANQLAQEAIAYVLDDGINKKLKLKRIRSSLYKKLDVDTANETKQSANVNSELNLPEHSIKNGAFSMPLFLKLPIDKKLSVIKIAHETFDEDKKDSLRNVVQLWIDSYLGTKHYDQALKAAYTLLAFKKEDKDADISANLWQIAYITSLSDHMPDSRNYYNQLFKDYSDMGSRSKAHWYYARGLAHDFLGDHKPALKDFKNATKLLSKHYKEIDKEAYEDLEYIYWLNEDLKWEIKCKRKDPPTRDSYMKANELYTWPKERMPLKVCIDKTRASGFGSKLLEIIEKGILQWTKIKKSPVTFKFVSDPEKADIYVERVDNHDQVAKGSAGRAQAEFYCDVKKDEGKINKVHLRIFSTTYNGCDLSNHGLRHLKTLAAHEFGHALGLGHSPNGQDIMYWKAAGSKISSRDIRTLLTLYGCKE